MGQLFRIQETKIHCVFTYRISFVELWCLTTIDRLYIFNQVDQTGIVRMENKWHFKNIYL